MQWEMGHSFFKIILEQFPLYVQWYKGKQKFLNEEGERKRIMINLYLLGQQLQNWLLTVMKKYYIKQNFAWVIYVSILNDGQLEGEGRKRKQVFERGWI